MSDQIRKLQCYWGFVAAGAAIGAAFLWPSTLFALLLGWVGVITLVWHCTCRPANLLWGLFFFGFTLGILGYYWLPYTIHNFGGFSHPVAALLYSLFCVVSSLQFVFVGFLYRRLRLTVLEDVYLAFPLSWLVASCVFPQMFPWRFANTQIAWGAFSSLAEYIGVQTLDILMLFWATAIVRLYFVWRDEGLLIHPKMLFTLATGLSLFLGMFSSERAAHDANRASRVKVGLIQGNLEAKKKGDLTFLEANLKVYRDLSLDAAQKGAEILFWPETVLATWIPENIKTFRGRSFDPWPLRSVPLVFGAAALRERTPEVIASLVRSYGEKAVEEDPLRFQYDKFNSVFASDTAGNAVGYFHKQALMPFGEYLPFSDIFPFLRKISPHSGDFTFGDVAGPIRIAPGPRNRPAAVQPLICYEDLVPSVAYAGARNGAEFLVNLTNDAWYGKSAAPYQHHAIAVWRAIETRRYLLRVTNTGYTAVVDSQGRTISDLPWFSAGVLVYDVPLLRGDTLAMRLNDRHNWLFAILAIGYFFAPRRSGLAEAPSSMKVRVVYE